MRILALTLMLSFLSHSAFGAETVKRLWTMFCNADLSGLSYLGDLGDENLLGRADGVEATKASSFSKLPDDLRPIVWTYLISEEVAAISKSTLLEARKTMAQKGFVLNMKDIEERNRGQLAQLLFDTSSVTKLKIKNLKWNILKSALESKPDLRFDNLEELDL